MTPPDPPTASTTPLGAELASPLELGLGTDAQSGTVSRAASVRLGISWGVLLAAGSIGLAFSPWLVIHAPLLLIALSPLPRHLLLVVPKVEFLPFVTVAVLRREVWTLLWYFVGTTYGERAIRWFEGRYLRMGRFVRAAERLFRRASLPLLVISPNPLFSLLAGAWGMRPALFVPLTLCGHAVWISIVYRLGVAFSHLITPITDWITAHVFELTLATVSLVVIGGVMRMTRNRRKLGLD